MLVMTAVQQDWAFTGIGTTETWQTAALSYGTRYFYAPLPSTYNEVPFTPGNVPYTELGGPKNIQQFSRLNVGVLTYSYDFTFLNYFGADGVKAVDAAFAILNALPAASFASPNLTEFITEGNQQINYTARALSMLDMKSVVLQLMIEHMGLLGETHVFDLRAQNGTCGAAAYDVVIRNFDPVTWNPSTYVNGTAYTYVIADNCTEADALEEASGQPGGGISTTSSAVATQEALQLGGFYLGITRDDMGGLRYLYRKDNWNIEALPTGCYTGPPTTGSPYQVITTNTNALTAGFTGILGGVDKITFVKVAYDSLIGDTFGTNVVHFTVPLLTNYAKEHLLVWRTNTAPDIIFSAADLLNTPAAGEDQPYVRTMTFLASPATNTVTTGVSTIAGNISPTMTVTLNNVGPLYVNISTGFLQNSAFFLYPYFQFGSFDGSTNAPIAFPNRTSLAALEALELSPPSGQFSSSPWNPLITTNVTAAGGTTGGTVTTGGTTTTPGGGGATAALARPAGANSPKP